MGDTTVGVRKHDRGKELTQFLEPDMQGQEKAKDRDRKEKRKNAFLEELIKIVLTNEEGKILPGCEWLISRKKLNMKTLRDLIKRSAKPTLEVDYFYDNHGIAFWMEDMLLQAQPVPSYYSIVPIIRREAFDVKKNPKYEGQTLIMITGVPNKAKDSITPVKIDTIREWILFAIVEEDPYSKPFVKDIERFKELIKEIDKKIKFISKMEFRNEDGSKMDDVKAESERELLYAKYGEDRVNAIKKQKAKEFGLKEHLEWRRKMVIDLTQGDVDLNTDTSVWYLRLYGTEDALELEDLLVKKTDWGTLRMCAGNETATPVIPPWAGRGNVPDGVKNPMLPNYTDLQVNIAGSRISRVPHGVGSWKSLDRQSSSIAADEFSMFYGDFEAGRRSGHGVEFTDSGVFCGRFINGLRDGHGRMDYGDGTTIDGHYGYQLHFRENNLASTNPYKNGEPHGQVEILFADGGMYRGNMRNGIISGQGEYQSALGEVQLGWFENGLLHGPNGYKKSPNGEKFKGSWVHGDIDQYGFYENEKGHTYEGFWDHGLRHGRGRSTFKGKGTHSGYYVYDTLSGKGELEYGFKKKKKGPKAAFMTAEEKARLEEQKKKEADEAFLSGGKAHFDEMMRKLNNHDPDEEIFEEKEPEFRYVYQGYFVANNITNGGIVVATSTNIPKVLSRRDKRACYQINNLLNSITKTGKVLRRQLEQCLDMESHIRKEICTKKLRIFRQQKHFTKKSMYAEDTYGGISKKDLKARDLVRSSQLERVGKNADNLVSKKARVPTLRTRNTDSYNYSSEVVEMIKPDPAYGNVKQVKKLMIKIAASDFDEIRERQRFLKYDLIWQRAEMAFSKKKSGG